MLITATRHFITHVTGRENAENALRPPWGKLILNLWPYAPHTNYILTYNYNNHNAAIDNSKAIRCLFFTVGHKTTAIKVAIVTNSIQQTTAKFFHFFNCEIKLSLKATISSQWCIYILYIYNHILLFTHHRERCLESVIKSIIGDWRRKGATQPLLCLRLSSKSIKINT